MIKYHLSPIRYPYIEKKRYLKCRYDTDTNISILAIYRRYVRYIDPPLVRTALLLPPNCIFLGLKKSPETALSRWMGEMRVRGGGRVACGGRLTECTIIAWPIARQETLPRGFESPSPAPVRKSHSEDICACAFSSCFLFVTLRVISRTKRNNSQI